MLNIFKLSKKNNVIDSNQEEKEHKELTTERLMAGAFKRHLPYKAFCEIDIGMIIDYMHEYNDLFYSKQEEKNEREATQNDFDNF